MKKLLITGATGGLGQNAVAYALARGMEVLATGRKQTVLQALESAGAHTYAGDLVQLPNGALANLVEGQDAVWHCAAKVGLHGSYTAFWDANVILPSRLFTAAAKAGVPVFVHISSPSQYFDYRDQLGVAEDAPGLGGYASYYAQMKAIADERLLELAKAYPATRLVILRPRVIFGPHDQVFLPGVQAVAQRLKGWLPLPRSGGAIFDPVYVENVVHAMALAIERPVPSGSVFNISNDEALTVKEFIARAGKATGLPLRTLPVPYAALAPMVRIREWLSPLLGDAAMTPHAVGGLNYHLTLDITAAKLWLGYSPQVSLEEGLQRTAAWLCAMKTRSSPMVLGSYRLRQ